MRFAETFAQVLRFDVSINLRGGDVGMSEHFLNRAQVGAALQQMRCKRMAQRVR